MSHHQANLEPLNIFEFLLTVLYVSKAADRCVSCTKTEGHLLLTHGSAAFEIKITVNKNLKIFSGSKLA
jgi:hypothetical protein